MIRIEDTTVTGWVPAIRGMRNPMNSWGKMDSKVTGGYIEDEGTYVQCHFEVGPNDLELMRKLCKGGADDRKFLRMIVVYADITAPLFFLRQLDTYKVGTVTNSCSTMHKIHARDLTVDDFSHEGLDEVAEEMLKEVITACNFYRRIYVKWDELDDRVDYGIESREQAWNSMIKLLPQSYNQRRTVMLNYEVLRNMYHARKAHKLDEWHGFCRWVEKLPYAYELIFGDDPAMEWTIENGSCANG